MWSRAAIFSSGISSPAERVSFKERRKLFQNFKYLLWQSLYIDFALQMGTFLEPTGGAACACTASSVFDSLLGLKEVSGAKEYDLTIPL